MRSGRRGEGFVRFILPLLTIVHAACALNTAGMLDRRDGGELPDGEGDGGDIWRTTPQEVLCD